MEGLFFGGFFLLMLLFFAVIFSLSILGFILWVMMLVDVLQRDFKESNDKTVWLVVIGFVGYIGAIVYYFTVKKHPEKYTKAN